MNELTPRQMRRRRRAAFALRQRAHDPLDDASLLDGLPAMPILMTDLKRIAETAGCDPEKLADAALALYPRHRRGRRAVKRTRRTIARRLMQNRKMRDSHQPAARDPFGAPLAEAFRIRPEGNAMRRLVIVGAVLLALTSCSSNAAPPTPVPATSTATATLNREDAYLAALHARRSPSHADPQALDFGRGVCHMKDTGLTDEATLHVVDSWQEGDGHPSSGQIISAHLMASLALDRLCPD